MADSWPLLVTVLMNVVVERTYAVVPPDAVVETYGGTANGAPCHFPFLDEDGLVHYYPDGSPRMCATVLDLGADYTWGYAIYRECIDSTEGTEYAGVEPTTTESGRTCQRWDENMPHAHTFGIGDFPDSDFASMGNSCRNPDGEPGIWCYTTDPGQRWEVCERPPDCDKCSGRIMSGDDVPDATFTVSSLAEVEGEVFLPEYARINSEALTRDDGTVEAGAWCANDTDWEPWFQVNLEVVRKFIGVFTQGRQDADHWVLEYVVQYSRDNASWDTVQNETDQDRIFYGLESRDDKEPYLFDTPFFAQYVRIVLLDWHGLPCLRFDFEACEDDDDCINSGCANGATCVDMQDDFVCRCTDGWTGALCTELVDLCEDAPCENGGMCTMTGHLQYSCACVATYSGDNCENGMLSSCEDVALNGAVLSGYYTIDYGTTGPCEMLAAEQSAWDVGTSLGYEADKDLTLADCEQLCMDDADCKSVNFYYSGGACHLRDFYAKNLITMDAGTGTTRMKACPGPKKVYCDLSNSTTPLTVVSHNWPQFYTGEGADNEWIYRSHLITYLPLLAQEIDMIKGDSYTCSQEMDFHCMGSIGTTTSVYFQGDMYPRELRSELYSGDYCECLLGDACTDTSFQCECGYHYNTNWYLDSDIFTDKHLLPLQGLSLKGLSSSRQLRANIGPMKCMHPTFEIDECSSDPCVHGGTCTEGRYSYNCSCPDGYEGQNCEIEINECESSPCFNDGVCADMTAQFYCICEDGYEGDQCEIDVNECISNPCLNGGSCVDMADRYRCACAPGWLGVFCDSEIQECASNPCQHGGICDEEVAGYNCSCVPGYGGGDCETDIDECADSPCDNGGVCEDQLGGYVCHCVDGYTGTNCQQDYDECSSDPCLHGATCHNLADEFSCACPPGYFGPSCEIDVDDCESSPCLQGECRDMVDGYWCDCRPGYTGETCDSEIDECVSDPCEHGRCVDGEDEFTCECDPGYSDDFCSTDINECLSFPCLVGGTCHNNISRFHCECPPGYSGDRCEQVTMDGQWSGWGLWSECAVQCGNGVRTRVRECNSPPPQNGGMPCPGEMSQVDPCTELNCEHVDGTWGTWGSWGRCSVTCGPGMKTRTRLCDNPAPIGDGADCRGSPESSLPCQEWECGQALDGRWSLWGPWGACSTSCGVGTTLRYRSCSDPPPVYGGDPCVGEPLGASSCMVRPCPAYDDCLAWSAWGDCSAPCGDGTHRRQRTCLMQEDLRIQIEAARARASQGAPEEEDHLLPDWFWDIEISLEQHAIGSCQKRPCDVHHCVSCSSDFQGTPGSLSCKGPKVSCSSDYPYCAYNFDPYAPTPGMWKACAAEGDCKNASVQCEALKIQTLQSIMSFSEADVGTLEPHPDTLLQSWTTLEEKCTICCQNSLCNRNKLPPSDTIYNRCTGPRKVPWSMILLTIILTLELVRVSHA